MAIILNGMPNKWHENENSQHNFPVAGSKGKYLLHPVTKIKSQTQAEDTRPCESIHTLERSAASLDSWNTGNLGAKKELSHQSQVKLHPGSAHHRKHFSQLKHLLFSTLSQT